MIAITHNVTINAYHERGICKVVEYGHLDNNRVIVEDSTGERFPMVAEWCHIEIKVEDQQSHSDYGKA